jgi:hypothetical protein
VIVDVVLMIQRVMIHMQVYGTIAQMVLHVSLVKQTVLMILNLQHVQKLIVVTG